MSICHPVTIFVLQASGFLIVWFVDYAAAVHAPLGRVACVLTLRLTRAAAAAAAITTTYCRAGGDEDREPTGRVRVRDGRVGV